MTVGLEKQLFKAHEEDELVEVCVVVDSPSIECPVKYSFNVSIWTEDKEAGTLRLLLIAMTNFSVLEQTVFGGY